MNKKAAQTEDKYVLRMPDGMRERIKRSAELNGRSMNAEIVKALETHFPPEPTIEEVLERIHGALAQADRSYLPYRQVLVDALDKFSERLASGIEFDQFRRTLPPKMADSLVQSSERIRRWRRVQEYGVEQHDLEREIERGLLRNKPGDTVKAAIDAFKRGKPEHALRFCRLSEIKFADPEAAYRAIEADLRAYYTENWGDPDVLPPWDEEEF